MNILILGISLIVACAIRYSVIPYAIVGWDESVYLMWAYKIYQSVHSLNIIHFIRVSKEQFDYPPLQSWVLGIILSMTGFTIEKARIIGLLWFACGSLVLYKLALLSTKKPNKIVGFVSVFLYLTSPLLIVFSGVALKETMGATLTLLTVLMYMKSRLSEKKTDYLITSIPLMLLVMTKYNYGVLLIASFAFEAFMSIFLYKRYLGNIMRHGVLFFLPILMLALWVMYPVNQFDRFMFILKNPNPFPGISKTIDYFLFYPRGIILMYAASPLLGTLIFTSWIFAVGLLKNLKIRLLWIPILFNLLLGTIHIENMQERYILTIVPLFFPITGIIMISAYDSICNYRKKSLLAFSICLIVASGAMLRIFSDILKIQSTLYAAGSYSAKYPWYNQKDYRDIWFNYTTTDWPHIRPKLSDEKPADVMSFIASSVDFSKPVRVFGRSNELSPPYFELIISMLREKNTYPKLPYPSFTVTVEVLPTSYYYTFDYKMRNAWLLHEVRSVQEDTRYHLLGKKRFNELGIETRIYTP